MSSLWLMIFAHKEIGDKKGNRWVITKDKETNNKNNDFVVSNANL